MKVLIANGHICWQMLLAGDKKGVGKGRHHIEEDPYKGVAGAEARFYLLKLGLCLIKFRSRAFKLLR